MDAEVAWHLFDAVIAVVAGAVAGGLTTRFVVEPYKANTQERLAHVESDRLMNKGPVDIAGFKVTISRPHGTGQQQLPLAQA